MKIFSTPYCEECGGASLAHGPEKFSQRLEDLVSRVCGEDMSVGVERFIDNYFGKVFTSNGRYAVMRALHRVGMGHMKRGLQSGDGTRIIALHEGAVAARVTLSSFWIGQVLICYIAEKKIGDEMHRALFQSIPRPPGKRALSMYFMDNKAKLKTFLLAHQIPTAVGGSARTLAQARSLWKKVGRSVITKPYRGSRGRHTTIKINSEEALAHGFSVASVLSPRVIVERYLSGTVHRITLIGGKPVAVAKREYPYVTGDGIHTIEELIDEENKNPHRDGVFFRTILKTSRLDDVLSEQGYTRNDVLEPSTRVFVNDKNSRLNGTVTEDVTDLVHPDNMALFERLGSALGDPVVGVDFMIKDMARPWTEQPDSGVLECNSMPFIDVHHRVVSGRVINVAEHLWREVFRE